jgi:hypothetical protein
MNNDFINKKHIHIYTHMHMSYFVILIYRQFIYKIKKNIIITIIIIMKEIIQKN